MKHLSRQASDSWLIELCADTNGHGRNGSLGGTSAFQVCFSEAAGLSSVFGRPVNRLFPQIYRGLIGTLFIAFLN